VRIRDNISEILQYIKHNWKLDDPRLILSVLNSNIQNKENEDSYIEGLLKVAINTGMKIKRIALNVKMFIIK
jgi:hypothetical protein